jgi:hypothetical protein
MTETAGHEKLLEKIRKALALPFSSHNFEDVVDALRKGEMQIFHNDDAVVITEICVTPRRRFINIFLAAGSLDGVYALHTQVVELADKHGITEPVQGIMRPGWGPHLKKRGWKKVAEVWTLPREKWNNGELALYADHHQQDRTTAVG